MKKKYILFALERIRTLRKMYTKLQDYSNWWIYNRGIFGERLLRKQKVFEYTITGVVCVEGGWGTYIGCGDGKLELPMI